MKKKFTYLLYTTIFILVLLSNYFFQNNLIIFNLLFLLPVYFFEKSNIIKSLPMKLIITTFLIMSINLLFINISIPLITPQKIGLTKSLINIGVFSWTNLLLFSYAFYIIYSMIKQNYTEFYKDINNYKFLNLLGIIIIVLVITSLIRNSNYTKYLPFVTITIYSLLLSYLFIKTFSKRICLWLFPLYALSLLISVIIMLCLLFTVLNYIPEQGRFYFTFYFAYLFNSPVAIIATIIFSITPEQYYAKKFNFFNIYGFLIIVLLTLGLFTNYYPIFNDFYRGF